MQKYDVIVIGAGGVGSAAMSALARRGASVLGIDRYRPPHDRGSSHGETRVIRQAYFEHADYVPLLRRAYELWRGLEERSGLELFRQCGLLEAGPRDGEVVPGVLRAAGEHQLPVEMLSPGEVTHRWPALRLPEGLSAVFESTAGYLYVEKCVSAMLAEAEQLGAHLLFDSEVVEWRADAGYVEVRTSDSAFQAGALIVAPGAWAGTLLAELGVPLQPVQKTLFWYPATSVPSAANLPVFLYELEYGVPYGFPSLDGGRMKIAVHSGGVPLADPLARDRRADRQEQRVAERFLRECLPDVEVPHVDHANCLYTMTPDGHFVVDRHPRHANVAVVAGLSGHGFKFTPVLGEVVADLLTEARSLPIEFLSAARFDRGNTTA